MTDFNIFLTPADIQEIENMPEPSLEQAEEIINRWETNYKYFNPEDVTQRFNALIFYKLYRKVKLCYPEYFI